jgi:hypothetical protein
MPLVADFMHINLSSLGVSLLGSFIDVETPIFLALLVPTGLLVYWAYYKNIMSIRSVGGGGTNPIAETLKHGYFFDDAYYAIAKGIAKFSDGVKYVEDSGTMVLDSFGTGLLRVSSKLKKVPSTTVQNYIAAAVVGLVLIVVLIILTVGMGV